MDSLPVELIRLVFAFCDGPTVRNVRLVSNVLAQVGYDYLIPAHFHGVTYRNDVQRLHSIACHERLRGSILSIAFDLGEERETTVPAPFHTQASLLEEALAALPNLTELQVMYNTKPPRDRDLARLTLNALITALRPTHLTALTFDALPLELFRQADDRRHWFGCARAPLAHLTRLDLALDPAADLYPSARFRAVNGLGRLLQFARPCLQRLALRARPAHAPREKFALCFDALLGGDAFVWPCLEELVLEGLSLADEDLRAFLVRHGRTLKRLRLGGRGLAKEGEMSVGGIHLHEGSFHALFVGLRGQLPVLERFHMEGDFGLRARRVMQYRAVTGEDWDDVPQGEEAKGGQARVSNSVELERYLIHGGEFPRENSEARSGAVVVPTAYTSG